MITIKILTVYLYSKRRYFAIFCIYLKNSVFCCSTMPLCSLLMSSQLRTLKSKVILLSRIFFIVSFIIVRRNQISIILSWCLRKTTVIVSDKIAIYNSQKSMKHLKKIEIPPIIEKTTYNLED